MENDRGFEETWTDWESGGRGTQISMFVGFARRDRCTRVHPAALVRPSRHRSRKRATTCASRHRALFGDEPLAAGRELLTEKVLPEIDAGPTDAARARSNLR